MECWWFVCLNFEENLMTIQTGFVIILHARRNTQVAEGAGLESS